jgi:sigma-B regulation protein RsbU (phosphoserine phosphatase)
MVIGIRVEAVVIASVRPGGHRLEWISDLIASAAVTTLTYLWLNLRASRARILDLERARITQDAQLRLAAEIQRSLLRDVPTQAAGCVWAARMEAAYEVGGDFYDVAAQADGSLMVIVGDVPGKGVPAALLQSSALTLFRVHATHTGTPAQLAERISADLRAQTGGRPYATAIIVRIERDGRRLTSTNAGHPAGLVQRTGELVRLTAGGPPLGLLPGVAYESEELPLHPGDAGVFVTDGITEVLDGREPLAAVLADARSLPEREAPVAITERVLRLAGTAVASGTIDIPADDRTAVAFVVGAGDDGAGGSGQ